VYRANTPSRLPPHELLLGLVLRSARLARYCARVRAPRGAAARLALGSRAAPAPAPPPARRAPPRRSRAPPRQALLVLAVWLGAVPLATCWLWRLVFVPSMRAGADALLARAAPLLLLTDCVYGSCLSAGIIFTILAVSSLREHLRAVRDVAGGTGRPPACRGIALTARPSSRSCASRATWRSPRASPPAATSPSPWPTTTMTAPPA
jgi:hypothetical protein